MPSAERPIRAGRSLLGLFAKVPEMVRSRMAEVSLDGVVRVVGPEVCGDGISYGTRHQVVVTQWDDDEVAIEGRVGSPNGGFFDTTVYFFAGRSPLAFEQGQCSCPNGLNCEHAVALVIAAKAIAGHPDPPAPAGGKPRSSVPAVPRRSQSVEWEAPLRSLLDDRSGAPGGHAIRRDGSAAVPLAIELTMRASASPHFRNRQTDAEPAFRMDARLMRPGKNGWWVNGGLTWSKLSSPYEVMDHPADQLQVLMELHALSKVGRPHRLGYGYSTRDDRTLELSAFESRQLWTVLDEARSVGIRFIHGKRALGELPRCDAMELCLDVRADDQGLVTVRPVLRPDPETAEQGPLLDHPEPVCFVGSGGHGLVRVERVDSSERRDPSDWRLRLAKLARPVPAQLQRMVLDRGHLEIPVAEHDRFRDDYCVRLRRLATVISSDESFALPEISEPKLVMRASYGEGHTLDVGWEWAYEIGATERRAALTSEPMALQDESAAYRDIAAEEALLSRLDLPLEQFGLEQADAGSAPAAARFDGLDTMRVSTELLPLLDGRDDIAAEIDGEPADYREVGDQVEIGITADEIAGETDWFDLGITINVEGRELPFATVFSALSRADSHLLLGDGAYFSLDRPGLQALRKLIEEAKALQDHRGDSLAISRFQVGLWDELTQLGVVARQSTAWQRQLEQLRAIDTLAPPEVPATLLARLRPYQVDGFGWLDFCRETGLGGILADDMGLGKTVQMLALICRARLRDPSTPAFLVVAPTSVVSTWVAEAERFAPHLRVVAITDTAKRRGESVAETIAGADVVVTSYTLYRLEVEAYLEYEWAGMVLDEAQNVKNHQAKIYQCVRRLPAPFKIAITGTPMENNLMELWSLLSITAPGLFPNPTRFRDYYARPIEKGDSDLLAQLRRRIRPLVKRRTKEQVAADLPGKQEQVLDVELHPRHRKIYQTHLQRERQKVLGLLGDMNKNRFTILRSLTLLRQLSLHPGLVDESQQKVPCAKLDALLEHLGDAIGSGHRALVFSQFTGFLDLVRQRLDAEGVEYAYLDGKTRNRARVIEGFKEGSASVFLISLKAGGFGLNLTEADYCFLLDPWWNPATEAQAVDRTHRIGQTRNVHVYRLVSSETIEDKVMALKARKAELFSNVMDDGNAFGAAIGADDIRALFD